MRTTGGSFSERCRSEAPRCVASISRSSMCSSATGSALALAAGCGGWTSSQLTAVNDTERLLQRGHAEQHLLGGVGLQGDHVVLDRCFLDLVRAGPLQRELADLVVHGHQLVDADPAFVARLLAVVAAPAAVELDALRV